MSATIYRTIVFLILLPSCYLVGLNTGLGLFSVLLSIPALILFFILEKLLLRAALSSIFWGITGLLVGTGVGLLLVFPFRYILSSEAFGAFSFFVITLSGYSFLVAGVLKGSPINLMRIRDILYPSEPKQEASLLDTNVLIDGRIADIAESGFISGDIILPQFVLQEIQYIADSPDALRRMRGRRGMEIVKRLQKITNLRVIISEEDLPALKEVDSKIIALARKKGLKIITNDYNLQKVAQLQGIRALNLNELANALKTLVLPGENLSLFVIKEGKEPNQGVAYLEDGTMVVVENGRGSLGKSIRAEVTSVLQTTGGRMIFARIADEG